ncbi:MAG: adenine deaminase [Proteobacteria bacterium]|nr:adenine deaminase [Pseudomonadota bacterium]
MKKLHLAQALGEKHADLVLKHCRLVNVLSGEIEQDVEIAISGNEIIGVGQGYDGDEVVDVAGRYVYPGLIDAHIHLESTKLTIPEAARLMARFGTAAVITDPHEIGNVAALDGIAYQMDSARDNGFIDVYFVAPSCVPTLADASIETAPSALGPDKLRMIAEDPKVVGLGEMMNAPGVLMGDELVNEKVRDYRERGLVVDGHAPMLGGKPLNAYIYMGIQSDHESTQIDEAREKLRRGMVVMIREGSSEKNLDELMPLINVHNAGRLMFASDDLDPTDLLSRGHINHLLKRAVAGGIPAITAIQMATLSPANYFGLSDRMGAIFPGALANLVISPDLERFEPDMVFHEGKVVFRDGSLVDQGNRPSVKLRPMMHVSLPSDISVKAEGKRARAIEIVPGQILTHEVFFEPKVESGNVVADASQDIAKVCVFERHRGSGAFGVAFVRGFGIQRGAMGSSVGHDSHNLVVVGMNDDDILRCAAMIRDMQGGQAAVLGDQTATLPLPVAGLMSDDTAENVIALEKALDAFCIHSLGVTLPRPMAALSFMALPVIPTLRITDQGLFYIAPGGYPKKVGNFC